MNHEVRPPSRCLFCAGSRFSKFFTYSAPPPGETRFLFSSGVYHREVWRCDLCRHFVSLHNMDEGAFYTEGYVNGSYGPDGLRRAFERITALEPSRSDNVGRVRRLLEFAETYLTAPRRESRAPTVLDVGSGLCVFLHGLKAAGWEGTALDPDDRAVRHAREVVGVKAVRADFMTAQDIGCYDVVTFNKVLEHVPDPVAMLRKSSRHVRPGGFIYIEVPDGEAAAAEGSGREEFFIEHHHVFSPASVALLVNQAGFFLHFLERLREPSTKFTLRTVMSPIKARGASEP